MWIVKLALRRPYTFVVMALLILVRGASTLEIVKHVKEFLPDIRAAAPAGLEIKELFDQSFFVRAAVRGVVIEGAIAAGLTGLMILLFLGSWRSTLIVILSIPLSLMVSLITMYLLGQTLNVMTLGGLALAVGIVVDDTTVEIENVHRARVQPSLSDLHPRLRAPPGAL